MKQFIIPVLAVCICASAHATGVKLAGGDGTDASVTADLTLGLGDSASLYVWVDPDDGQTINGLGLDITSSIASVLEATNFEIFNPIVISTFTRWNTPVGVGTLGDLVDNSNAVSIGSLGMDSSQTTFGDWVLHARIDFDATGIGVTDVMPALGAAGASDTLNSNLVPTFSGGTVTVTPEPATLALLGLGGLAMLRRRK